MIDIDGSTGEGGGQVLRSSLGLSLVTGTPVRIRNIRAGRKRPGLMRQHLCAVGAAAAIGDAELEGDAIGSTELRFVPKTLRGGSHRFAVGSAGSAGLVFQTILPALLAADEPSEIAFEGGTHNAWAPPFDFLERSFLPAIRRLGAELDIELERHGFYPAGGGRFVARVQPSTLRSAEFVDRGAVGTRRGLILLAKVPRHVGERELKKLAQRFELSPGEVEIREIRDSLGPGNAVMIEVEHAGGCALFADFGDRKRRAERVAGAVARDARAWLEADVPVCPHLADQLLLPMALAGRGRFRTMEPTQHTRTNIWTIQQFLDIPIELRPQGTAWEVRVGG